MSRKAKGPQGPGGQHVPVPDFKKGPKAFFEGVAKEMRRVVWPPRSETVRLTIVVLIVCMIFVIYLWVAGFLIELVFNGLEGKRPN